MVVVRIELWPMGDKARARVLGEAALTCTGTSGDGRYGAYRVLLSKFGGFASGIWRAGECSGHDRVKRGPYDLLYRALGAVLGQRVPDHVEPAEEIEDRTIAKIVEEFRNR